MLCFQLFYASILLVFISGIDSRLPTTGFVLQANVYMICEANGTKKKNVSVLAETVTSLYAVEAD